ncbi:hypothetical protein ACI2KR_08495 [Pseudomonas luteola]
MSPEVGQIWLVNDKRSLRYVEVCDRAESGNRLQVATCYLAKEIGYCPSEVKGKPRYVQAERFNGKSKGYSFVASSRDEFVAKGLHKKLFSGSPLIFSKSPLNQENRMADHTHDRESINKKLRPKSKIKLCDMILVSSPDAVEPGQIWRVNDKRCLRYIETLALDDQSVSIRTAYVAKAIGDVPSDVHNGTASKVKRNRFNGRSKGYTLVARTLAKFSSSFYATAPFTGQEWDSSDSLEIWGPDVGREIIGNEESSVKSSGSTGQCGASGAVVQGQVWRANDSRSLRFVLVDKIIPDAGIVKIKTIYVARKFGDQVRPVQDCPISSVKAERFNGLSNGYSLVAENVEDFKERKLEASIFGGVQPEPSADIVVVSVPPEPVNLEFIRESVKVGQLWQDRHSECLNFVMVVSIADDEVSVVSRYRSDDPNSEADLQVSQEPFKVPMMNFLPEMKMYHLVM